MIKSIALWGIALNVFGVLGLFYFGAPFRLPTGGANMVVVGSTPHGKALDAVFSVFAWISLAFVIVGSGLQAYAVWLS